MLTCPRLRTGPAHTHTHTHTQAVSDYHYLLLHPDKLVAVNQARAPCDPGALSFARAANLIIQTRHCFVGACGTRHAHMQPNLPSPHTQNTHTHTHNTHKHTTHTQVSGKAVAEVPLGGGAGGAPLALLRDPSSPLGPYLVTGDALADVVLSNEGRGMWRTYLEYQARHRGVTGASKTGLTARAVAAACQANGIRTNNTPTRTHTHTHTHTTGL